MKQRKQKSIVWDLPTRLFHWLLAGLTLMLLITGYREAGSHALIGMLLLTLLLWRLLWGVVGSETSRFRQFIHPPRVVFAYIRGRYPHARPGHNPAGGWMVVVMLSTLLLQALSGLLISGLLDESGLAWLFTEDMLALSKRLHGLFANLILLLMLLHLAAILVYRLAGRKLVTAMITGTVERDGMSRTSIAGPSRALIVMIVAVLLVIGLVAI